MALSVGREETWQAFEVGTGVCHYLRATNRSEQASKALAKSITHLLRIAQLVPVLVCQRPNCCFATTLRLITAGLSNKFEPIDS